MEVLDVLGKTDGSSSEGDCDGDEGDEDDEDAENEDWSVRDAQEIEQGIMDQICIYLGDITDFLDQLRASYSVQDGSESTKHSNALDALVAELQLRLKPQSEHKNKDGDINIQDLWSCLDKATHLTGARRKEMTGEIEQAPAAKRRKLKHQFDTAWSSACKQAAATPGKPVSLIMDIGA
jgi:hypothetical protein